MKQIKQVAERLTHEQKTVAERWNLGLGTVTPAGVWNLIARDLARKHRLDDAHTARLFAALNISMMDAFIACWRAKFTTKTPARYRFAPASPFMTLSCRART